MFELVENVVLKDFETASQRHEEITKEAFIGAMAKPFISAAKWAIKKPWTALGAIGTASELAIGAKDLSKSVADYAAPVIRNSTGTF